MVRSGKQTSEFWAAFLVSAVLAVNAVLPEAAQLIEISDETAMKIVGGLWSLYSVVRGWVKGAEAKA